MSFHNEAKKLWGPNSLPDLTPGNIYISNCCVFYLESQDIQGVGSASTISAECIYFLTGHTMVGVYARLIKLWYDNQLEHVIKP